MQLHSKLLVMLKENEYDYGTSLDFIKDIGQGHKIMQKNELVEGT